MVKLYNEARTYTVAANAAHCVWGNPLIFLAKDFYAIQFKVPNL